MSKKVDGVDEIAVIRLIGESFPKNQRARMQLAVGLAIKLARDRWTRQDDEKLPHDLKGYIFNWAKQLSKIPPEVWSVPPSKDA